MLNDHPLREEDARYDRIIPGARATTPFGDFPNIEYDGQYPTVIYSLNGEPKAFSTLWFTTALNFALNIQKIADYDVNVIWTDRYWSI